MDAQKVDMFILSNSKYFDSFQLQSIRQELINAPEEKWARLQTLQFKDPTTMLIVSILAGSLGIDRFLIGDVGLGIGKLITCGGAGIWTIVDWFLIQGSAKEKNMRAIQEALLF
jgi:TM2 domain-containing membrane protein YozV